MALLKKNQLNNIFAVMVDKTDFASIESGMSANDIDIKLWGVAQGSSTAASAITVSKAAALVYSGLFCITLKAVETDAHDHFMMRLSSTSTVSCAIQMIPLEMVDYDDSDIMSRISDTQSDIRSYLVGMSGMLSDVYSNLSDFKSDFQSRVPKAVASQSLLSDVRSDIRSYLVGMSGMLSDVYSNLSDLKSDFQSRVPKQAATASQLSLVKSVVSDAHSAAAQGNSRILVVQSMVSDIDSQLLLNASMISDVQSAIDSQALLGDSRFSDIMSNIDAVTATLSASDISDIASAVVVAQGSRLSDILSAAQQGNSRILVVQSMVSDVDSQLTVTDTALDSQYSDLASKIGNVSVALTASDISDIASAVAVAIGSSISDIESQLDVTASKVILIQSDVSDIQSAVDSQFVIASNYFSNISAMISDVDSQLNLNASVISDAHSAAAQTNSRALVIQSMVSDVDSQLLLNASMISDIDSQLTVTHSLISDIESAIDALDHGIKKNTALSNFEFLMVDSTDHVTPKTGRTVTATRSIDGGAFASCANSVTELSNGIYVINLAASDLNGDVITFRFTAADSDDRFVTVKTSV